MFELQKEFEDLVEYLNDNLCSIEVMKNSDYLYGYKKDNPLMSIGFCTKGGFGVYYQLNGKIAIYKGKFNNWGNSIINLPLPTTNYQRKFLVDAINLWDYKDEQFCKNNRNMWITEYSACNVYGLK